MINDPYSILGISKNATDDEVKHAYRDLSRKYHPDSYSNNPLADLAEEKFKEVQDAYNQIMQERQTGGGYRSGSSYQQSSGQTSPNMTAVYNFLNSGRYQDALNSLYTMQNRDANWYYCSAVANAGIGNNIQAQNDARQAVNMEPNNPQYRQLLNQLQWGGQRYQTTQRSGGGMPSTGNCCCDLWIADSCCECMGGDICSCM